MDHNIVLKNIEALEAYANSPRKHSRAQIRQVANSIEEFGFINPVIVTEQGMIVAGHCRVEAAKLLDIHEVPTLPVSHLTESQVRAYIIADNKLALNAGWDEEKLAYELKGLIELDMDLTLTGFSLAELELVLNVADAASPKSKAELLDGVPSVAEVAVSVQGDLWILGRHRLICGDARSASDFAALMGDEQADMVFTDPPYNVKIDGNVCGLGTVKHREFAFASGEMSQPEFVSFLSTTLGNVAGVMRDGAIAFVCMDWRHMGELLEAGNDAFTELKNLVVWNKSNGGMGTFYRSKHELIFVFKQGTKQHTNTFGLGETGRYRTNVWDYPGISALGADRDEELAMHPTVKPVALIADAIRDCSKRGEIVLDCFGGSGSTLISAHQTGRLARLIEYDPLYCDTIIRRWQQLTGKDAVLAANGRSFEDVSEGR
ncbi:DNA methyltransferase [Sphingomonas sp. YL-JM2C]